MVYWLVSLPLQDGSTDRTWNSLQELTTYANDYSVNFKIVLPEFRVGTLDSLLALSDDLVKVNSSVEGTVNKIRRQLFDLQSNVSIDERADVWVEGKTPEGYLQQFKWNEAKYPSRRPLKDTVQAITDTVLKMDDDLKMKATELSQLRTQLQAMARKQTGSLAVRELSDLVNTEQIVETENLTTLLVVVGKTNRRDWLQAYETLSDFVVPRSSVVVAEDSDYVVFTVVLFRRVVDNFKTAARQKGFQVKEYNHDVEAQQRNHEATDAMKAEAEAKRAVLEQWCITSYGEVFSSWIHITAVRLFVESILRYGLPPQFLSALMRPNPKSMPKLRKLMASRFGAAGGEHFSSEGGGEDIYPYVSFTINVEG